MAVDPRTPVIVGVGQFTERIQDPDYRGMSAVDLATAATLAALTDTGADEARVAESVDTVFALRQFEISGPMPATLGKSNNYPRSVMNRLGGDPARVVLEPVGGHGPQKLVTEAGGVPKRPAPQSRSTPSIRSKESPNAAQWSRSSVRRGSAEGDRARSLRTACVRATAA